MNLVQLLQNIGCKNARNDGMDRISSLRDGRWVKMFAEMGYDRGEFIFPDGRHSSFFLVLPDGNIASADNVMCGNGFYAIANELGIDADAVLGEEPYGEFIMYTDEDGIEDEDTAISIWTPEEFQIKLQQCQQLANKQFNETKNMNKKNTIRLTESELKSLIAESVKNILKEDDFDDAMGRGEDYDFNDRGNDPYDNGDAVYSQESETIMRAAQGMGDILWIASDPSNIKGKTPADTAFWALSDIMHKLNDCLPAIVNCNDEEFWNLFPQNSPTKDKKWWRNFLQKLRGIYKDIADLEWISRQVKAQKFYNIIYKLTKDEE